MSAAHPADDETAAHWTSLLRSVSALLWQLQSRDARLAFCPAGHWSARTQPLTAERIPEVVALFKDDLQSFRPFAGPKRYTRVELESGSPIVSATTTTWRRPAATCAPTSASSSSSHCSTTR